MQFRCTNHDKSSQHFSRAQSTHSSFIYYINVSRSSIFPRRTNLAAMAPFDLPKCTQSSFGEQPVSNIRHRFLSSSGSQGFPAFFACGFPVFPEAASKCFKAVWNARTTSTWLQLSLSGRSSPVSGFTPSASSSRISFARSMFMAISCTPIKGSFFLNPFRFTTVLQTLRYKTILLSSKTIMHA